MKKLLALGLSVTLITSSGALVVACAGSAPSNKVQVWLLGESASASSKIKGAYEALITDYNLNAREDNLPEIEFSWKAAGTIEKQMISNKQKLPDLYISYPDKVSYFKEASTTKTLVRDMQATMGDSFQSSVADALVSPVYLDEGTIGEEINVLPYFKSLDFAVINLNLFREIAAIIFDGKIDYNDTSTVGGSLTRQINLDNLTRAARTSNKNEKINTNLSNIRIFGSYDKDAKTYTPPSADQIAKIQNAFGTQAQRDALKTEMLTWDASNVTANIQATFVDQNKLLPFIKAVNAAINYVPDTSAKPTDKKGIAAVSLSGSTATPLSSQTANNFAIGIDSLTNKYFMDYAAASNNNKVVTDGDGDDFLYTVNADVAKKKATVTLNSQALGIPEGNKFLDDLKDLAISNGQTTQESKFSQWNGVFMTNGMVSGTSTYSSAYFSAGTMLYGSGSSAGMWAYQNATVLSRWDMLTSSSMNSEGKSGLFLSQGPGIAGFDSQGSNAADKEATVKDFLEFIYQGNIQGEYSIKSGYLPSTKDGLSVFEKYHSEKFNNATGKWSDVNGNQIALADAPYAAEVERLQDKYNFEFKKVSAVDTNSPLSGNWLSIDLLNEYFGLNPTTGVFEDYSGLNLVIGTPNILGEDIRGSIDSTIKTGTGSLLDLRTTQDINFSDMFNSADNKNYQLGKWIKEKRNDVIGTINIIHKD